MSQIGSKVGVLGSLALSAGLLSAGAHILLGDYLLFYSDPVSLGVYLSAVSVLLLPVLLVLYLPLLFAPLRWRNWLRYCLALGLAGLVATVFLMLTISFVGAWLDLTLLKRLARHPFVLFAVSVVPAAAMIIASRRRKEIAGRIEQFGLALLGAAVIGLSATQLIQSERGTGSGKQLVLMILDAMPTQHLHSYEAAAPIGPLDQLAAEGLLFTETRTSATWTHAYFGTLFSGSTRTVEAPQDEKPAMQSLLARLQRGGVAARWIAHHRNGIPEGSAAQINDYRGLRSYLLTENTVWIPRLLNLDYHLAIAAPSIAQNLRGTFGRAVFAWLNNNYQTQPNTLTGLLLPQLREQRARANNSFMLFHINWASAGIAAEQARVTLPAAQEIQGLDQIDPDATKTIRANDYQYGPEVEPLAEKNRRANDLGMINLGLLLADFMAALAADESLRNTVVVITADHGSMYAKGRFWYGYHPNEEVVRVPLLILNGGRKGRDGRLVSTPDITASVLGFFGLPYDDKSAHSIFEVDRGRDRTTALTMRSNRNKEWFLVVNEPGRKYRANLHPDGRGETVTLRIDGYEETPIAESIGPPEGKADLIAAALHDYGIDSEDVHPALRP